MNHSDQTKETHKYVNICLWTCSKEEEGKRKEKNTVHNTFQFKQHIPINQATHTHPLYETFQTTEIYMELGEGGNKGLCLQTEKKT